MVMRTLIKKSFKDIRKSRSQFISIIIMATLAVSIVTGLDSIWKTLDDNAVAMYSATNLSDLWVNVVNPTEKELWSIQKIKGVQALQKRFSLDANADLKGNPTLHVYTSSEQSRLDLPKLEEGKLASKGGAVLDINFAKKHGLEIGDDVSIEINKKWLRFTIEGLALSSEHIFSVKGSTGMIPNPEKYGFIIINEDRLISAYGQKLFNQICVRLAPDADVTLVKKQIDEAIGDDLIGIVSRDDHRSVSDVNAKIQQFKILGSVFPLMFFLVTALITQSTMVRLVENQRNQIGVLKALGYTKGSILWHYTSYGVYMCIIGAAAGVIIGPNVFGRILIPILSLTFGDYKILINYKNFVYSATLLLICTGGVSFYSCFKLLGDTPAILLRDKPPKEGSHIFLEYYKELWDTMKFRKKLIARNTLKNKVRLIMSILGITGCCGQIIAAFTVSGMVNGIADQIFTNTFVYDQKIILDSKVDSRYIYNSKLDAILQEVQEQAVEVICPDGRRKMEPLSIYSQESPLVHLKDISGREVKLPQNGITMTRKLAQTLNVKVGDSIKIKWVDEDYVEVPIRQIVYMATGQGMYMTDAYWESMGEDFKATTLYVKWNHKPDEDFLKSKYVKEYVNRSNQKADVERNTRVVYTAVVILVIMGAILAFVVLYNCSILNFTERIRDLATLRVLGYYHNEIRSLVLMENILSVIAGSILGIPLGKAIADIVAKTLDEQMDLISRITPLTVFISGVMTLIFALIINNIVAKKMKTIDMLEALKSVE